MAYKVQVGEAKLSGSITFSESPTFEGGLSANEQNIKTNYDFNGEIQSGAGYYQITTNKWLRSDTDICFLKPALKRSNLTVLTNTLVTKIIIKNKKVIGVKVSKNGNTKTLKCGKEVILSAGTVNSPQLLQISGIGDQKYLSKIGIKTILDLHKCQI